MKLLSKYSRFNLFSTLIIFLFSGIVFYFLLNLIFTRQTDDDLKIEKHEIELYVQRYHSLPDEVNSSDQVTTFEPAARVLPDVNFSSEEMSADKKEEKELFRKVEFYITADQRAYKVTVAESEEATEQLMKTVIAVSVITMLIVLLTNILINRQILKKLWKPFYSSLDLVKNYKPGKNVPVFSATNIDEFNALNQTLENAVNNTEREFRTLKEFTENASHEMQTPLAVIRSKMDVLIQDEQLSESQSVILQGMYEALKRLARLNQSMLLLHKIENNLFEKRSLLDFRELTEKKIVYFNELMQSKSLHCSSSLGDARINMNPELADILLNNLFSNAIRHTGKGGKIHIELEQEKLLISNSSDTAALDGNKIFRRFYKEGPGQERHGLGLAIAEQICIASGFRIGYDFTGTEHRFTVFFNV